MSRAASRAATTVDEEVTFYPQTAASAISSPSSPPIHSIIVSTYDGGNGKGVLLSVLEQLEAVIADDNAGLAGQNLLDTHFWL